MPVGNSPDVLDYGLQPRRRRRRMVRLGIVGVLAVSAVAGYLQRRAVERWAKLQAYQRQCVHYVRPANQVVLMEGPGNDLDALAKDPAYHIISERYDDFSKPTYVTRSALPFDRIDAILNPPAPIIGGGLFGGGTPLPGTAHSRAPARPVLFLHGRTSHAGHDRLVAVFIERDEFKAVSWFLFGKVFPCDWRGPKEITSSTGSALLINGTCSNNQGVNWITFRRVSFFAGQPDAADAARFAIAYDMDGAAGTIVGKLSDDDTVELEPADGPGASWFCSGRNAK